jgi:hypothetical protein
VSGLRCRLLHNGTYNGTQNGTYNGTCSSFSKILYKLTVILMFNIPNILP